MDQTKAFPESVKRLLRRQVGHCPHGHRDVAKVFAPTKQAVRLECRCGVEWKLTVHKLRRAAEHWSQDAMTEREATECRLLVKILAPLDTETRGRKKR